MNQGDQRVPCPKCKANNFLATTNCWQCGSSLPPPEAFGAAPQPAPQGVARRPHSFQPASVEAAYQPTPVAGRGGLGVIIAVIVALIVVIGGGAAIVRSRS